MWQRHVTMNRIAKAHVKSYRVYCVESDSTDDDTGHGGRKGSLYFGNTLLTETYGSNQLFFLFAKELCFGDQACSLRFYINWSAVLLPVPEMFYATAYTKN